MKTQETSRYAGYAAEADEEKKFDPVLFWMGFGFFLVMSAMLATIFAALKHYYYDSDVLAVDTIMFSGNIKNGSVSELSDALASSPEMANFVRLDVDSLQQMLQSVPWVETASVRKAWPSTVMIAVTERHADARWGDAKLYSRTSGIFDGPASVRRTSLPLLSGPDGTEEMVFGMWQKLQGILPGVSIAELSLSPRHSWEAVLEDGTKLFLGRGEDAVYGRMQAFSSVYARLPAEHKKNAAYFDLRYESGSIAIGWKKDAYGS